MATAMVKQVMVQGGTEARIEEGLTLAVSHFVNTPWLDPTGQSTQVLTAGLWIDDGTRGEPELVRVHPGACVETARHRLQVVAVRTDGRPHVRLDVERR